MRFLGVNNSAFLIELADLEETLALFDRLQQEIRRGQKDLQGKENRQGQENLQVQESFQAIVEIIPAARTLLVRFDPAFADRAYKSDGTLLSRREKSAVLSDPAIVAERMVKFVETGKITAIDGKEITLDAQSICLHGDSPSAVLMAKAVKAGLEKAGVSLKPFVD